MCPACYASMAMAVAGVTSAGGATAFVATKVYKKRRKAKLAPHQPKRQSNGNPGNSPS